ncbi:universal stress protein [Devosia submarina]|uniref:universal stress protein n=1 Tax=Devosia submarina TaxID=1173082 RepID=UPI00130046CA|nr:universal stress protein [Devosia submarina]
MFHHLVVAVDGSELAERALRSSLELARVHGSRVTIITCTDPISAGLGTGGFGTFDAASVIKQLEQAYAAEANQVLDAAKKTSTEAGIDAETLYVPNQRAADSILENSEKLGCDLVVMGSHGRRGFQKLLLGSQAAAVLAGSKVPVLIIK